MIEAWRGTGDPRVASPIIYEGRRRLALRHRSGAKRRAGGWRSDPMRETGAPSTGSFVTELSEVCPPHRGSAWSHHSRSCATRRGRKAKAALSNRGGLEQRCKQHTHYKGRDALKHNSEPGHLGSCMAYRGGAMQEFSEVRAVASRNSLYQTLAINVAVRGVVEG